MATIRTGVEVCNRCNVDTAKPAVVTERFAYGGVEYDLPLCQAHADLFGRDLYAWARLAEQVSPVFATAPRHGRHYAADRRRETERTRAALAQLAADQRAAERAAARLAEIDGATTPPGQPPSTPAPPDLDDPRGFGWTLSAHALHRAAERGFSRAEVLRAAADPERTHRLPGEDDSKWEHVRGTCRAVVNPATQTVVTVTRASETWLDDQQLPAASERAAR